MLSYSTSSQLQLRARAALELRRRREAGELNTGTTLWSPQPGQQARAFACEADQIGYGGGAGGGKTDLALGLAALRHRRSIIFRRTFPSVRGIIERSREIFARDEGRAKDSYNEQLHVWRLADGVMIEFGSLQREEDKRKHQGQPRDLIVFDEATEFAESQVRFVAAWNRSATPGVHCQLLLTFNPPMGDGQDWVIAFFAPWLQEGHADPAADGEIRFVAMVDGREQFYRRREDVPPDKDGAARGVKSRTFFRATLADNPILAATGYGDTIDALPEPLRSLLKGQFGAGRTIDPWQVIPRAWVEAAQARWTPEPVGPRAACGVDVARGGDDETAIVWRHGAGWFAPIAVYPGRATPDGPTVAQLVVADRPTDEAINVDVIGVGASVYDHLRGLDMNAHAMSAAEGSTATDRSGKMQFANKRAEWWWTMREALDPSYGDALALPPDDALREELCAPRWRLQGRRILVESKADIRERIGRSTNRADAVLLALCEGAGWLLWE